VVGLPSMGVMEVEGGSKCFRMGNKNGETGRECKGADCNDPAETGVSSSVLEAKWTSRFRETGRARRWSVGTEVIARGRSCGGSFGPQSK